MLEGRFHRRRPATSDGCGDFDFDEGIGVRERGDHDAGAGGVSGLFEVCSVYAADIGKVFDAGQEDGGLEHVLKGCSRRD